MNRDPHLLTNAEILVIGEPNPQIEKVEAILNQHGCQVQRAIGQAGALVSALVDRPELIIIDVSQCEEEGCALCGRLLENDSLRDTPVVFLTVREDMAQTQRVLQRGSCDHIPTPVLAEELVCRVGQLVHLRRLELKLRDRTNSWRNVLEEKLQEISDSQMATLFALARLAEQRDPAVGKHLERVQTFCQLLAAEVGKQSEYKSHITPTYIRNLFHASPLHDIGKVGIRDRVLLKPGKLTPKEFNGEMKQHVVIGAQTLMEVYEKYPKNVFVNMGIVIARCHHEKWDGSGYPEGLSGEDIPVSARIMAVADVYDALSSRRCYKPAYSHDDSCQAIFDGSGGHFDPAVVEGFRTIADQFPEISATTNAT